MPRGIQRRPAFVAFTVLSTLLYASIPAMAQQDNYGAAIEFTAPFPVSSKSESSRPFTGEQDSENLLLQGLAFVKTEDPTGGSAVVRIGALGSPKSEWSQERAETPDRTIHAYSEVGAAVTTQRPGRLKVTIDYTVTGKSVTAASYWASSVVPLSAEDVFGSEAQDAFGNSFLGEYYDLLELAQDVIEAGTKRSAAEVNTAVVVEVSGAAQYSETLQDWRAYDFHPHLLPGLDPSKSEVKVPLEAHSKTIELDVTGTSPVQVVLRAESTGRVWGWASAAAKTVLQVERITFSGPALAPAGVRPDFTGVAYEETEPVRFVVKGDRASLNPDSGGRRQSRYWAANQAAPTLTAFWRLNPTSKGNWEIYVFVPADPAATQSAEYVVLHDAQRTTQIVNQRATQNQWVSLGTYYFAAQGDEGVFLSNHSGEPPQSTRVQFDAAGLIWRPNQSSAPALPCFPAFALPFVAVMFLRRPL